MLVGSASAVTKRQLPFWPGLLTSIFSATVRCNKLRVANWHVHTPPFATELFSVLGSHNIFQGCWPLFGDKSDWNNSNRYRVNKYCVLVAISFVKWWGAEIGGLKILVGKEISALKLLSMGLCCTNQLVIPLQSCASWVTTYCRTLRLRRALEAVVQANRLMPLRSLRQC